MPEIIATCPYRACGKIVFKRGKAEFDAAHKNIFSFETRCPHCGNKVSVEIGIGVKTEPVY